MTIEFSWRLIFEILILHKPSLRGPVQNLDSIGSAVLTFIGYKQTDKYSSLDKITI